MTMTKEEFAERYQISVRTLERLMKRREVSFMRIAGGVVRFTEENAREFERVNTVAAVTARPFKIVNS